jgi:hypothetical protein
MDIKQKVKVNTDISINASSKTVWQVLTSDQYIHLWCNAFANITDIESTWEPGAKVQFLTTEGVGLIGTVAERTESTMLVVYQGVIDGGIEDYKSAAACAVKSKCERYTIKKSGEQRVILEIVADVDESFQEDTMDQWTNALSAIKNLAEQSEKHPEDK